MTPYEAARHGLEVNRDGRRRIVSPQDDGLDATTWRGLPFQSAVMPTLVLLGFSAIFGAITVLRFRWEEA